jgi:glycosyltransferase involved in cell wall biosynthesis
MNKKILIGCFEIPGWGGASTSAYDLFAQMLNDGYDVSFINLISENDETLFETLFNNSLGNPKHLPNVHNYFLAPPQYGLQDKLVSLIEEISPNVILATGWIAALIMKKASPKRKLIYLTSGSDQVKSYIQFKRLDDYLYLEKYMKKNSHHLKTLSKQEKEAVILSDFVITHSDMIHSVYEYFYPTMTGKIYSDVIWFADWIYKEASNYNYLSKNFSEREIDLIFISSDWTRPEKNYKFVKKLAALIKDISIHIVGLALEYIPGVTFDGVITDREKIFELLGNSKTIVCPSVFDAAPGILFEASALGCNIITSKNCGNWKICNELLLVDPFTLKTFKEKIILSLQQKFPDNINFFLQTGSYKNLIETVNLF